MIAESKLVRQALNIPYQRWKEIEPMLEQTKDAHTKEVLKRLMFVKRNRLNNGTGTLATKEYHQGGS